jgi:uncharacterized RDD family membrane protein YckC
MTYVPPPPAAPPQGYAVPPGSPLLDQGVPPPGTRHSYPPPGWYRPVPPLSPSGAPLASFPDRLVAFILDALIVGGVTLAIAFPMFLALMVTQMRETELRPDGVPADMGPYLARTLLVYAVFFGFSMTLSYVYYVELMFRSGQTVGKRVMKLHVMPLDPRAGRLTRAMAAQRWLVAHVASIAPGFVWLDGLWQLWDKPYQQCLHDKFARTVVVKLPADGVR